MIVAHLGPASGRIGGPAGYLGQLSRAIGQYGGGSHTVLFPPSKAEARPAGAASASALRSMLRRVRLTLFHAPQYFRPSPVSLGRLGGGVDQLIAASWATVGDDAQPSLEQALTAKADVLFAHDAPSAELALASRAPEQQVWLMLHAPMSLALYLAWSWGVPEQDWQEIRSLPDVQAWTARELKVIKAADRVWIPCREAANELERAQARFGGALKRVSFLMTGAAGPLRALPSLGRPALRARFGLPAKGPVGLFLGNAQPYRGLDLLKAALRRLPSARSLPGVVAVAGCPADSLPFHPRLRALGFVREVGDLLAAVDFVVNVNRFSLFDLSTIEALEAGRPMLLSPVGGNVTFRDLGAGVVMLDDLSPAAIAGGLARMFGMAEHERHALGSRARQCYEQFLTPRHLRDRHVAAYDDAAAIGLRP